MYLLARSLESNPTTAAFAGEYKKTIGDDEDTVMLHSELTEEPEAARAEETVDEEEEDEDEVQESITRAEIVRQVQEHAQNSEVRLYHVNMTRNSMC